jgi:hypothetical protein
VLAKGVKCPKCGRKFRAGKPAGTKSQPRQKSAQRQEDPDDFRGVLESAVKLPDAAAPEVSWEPEPEEEEEEEAPPALPAARRKTARKKKSNGAKSSAKKSRGEDESPWLMVALCVGGLAVMGGFIVGFIMFLPPGAVGLGSTPEMEAPSEFVEFKFAVTSLEYVCEYPKGWAKKSGGGREGIPSWAKFEHEGASIRISDSIAGTPAAMIDRANNFGTPIQNGTAPVGAVHEHRKKGVADSMREYVEKRPQKIESKMGDALLAEFTSNPLFGDDIRGYHATVLCGFHQYTIVCRCGESQWDSLNAAFQRVIKSMTPPLFEGVGF